MKSIALTTGIFMILAANSPCQKINYTQLESLLSDVDKMITTDNRQFFKNVESIIAYSDGQILFEKYYNGFDKDSVHSIQSQTKSIIALLAGIAIDKGYIGSENDPVSKYLPSYFNGSDQVKSSVTIRDLLTMSAGFKWEEMLPFNDPANDNTKMFQSNRWFDYAVSKPMVAKPFTEFKYNSGCPMIMAAIIEKATKMKLDEFAAWYLFEPMNIRKYRWLKDLNGFCHAGGGLDMKPMDMLKIGILVLNKGSWDNKQLISESWIDKVTSAYLPTSFDISSYGYFWWIREMKKSDLTTTKVISAEGAGGQKLYIFPHYKLIIAFTERNYSTPQVGPVFINEQLIPVLN